MRTDIRLPVPRRPHTTRRPRVLIVDGFGQTPDSPVTHDVAAALAGAFPQASVPPPIATATQVGEDVTLQLDFHAQAGRVHAAVTASTAETHVYAYSQGCIPVASVLGAHRYPHIASVMLVGAPLRVSRERARIAELDASGMGGAFEYVETHTPTGARLAGVVVFQPAAHNRLYVGITEAYATSFPGDDTHERNLAATIRAYPTTLVACGAENVTDCTHGNAAAFAADHHLEFTAGGSRLVVIPGAPHRLGHTHRTVTVPRMYRHLTTLTRAQR